MGILEQRVMHAELDGKKGVEEPDVAEWDGARSEDRQRRCSHDDRSLCQGAGKLKPLRSCPLYAPDIMSDA